MKKLTLLFALMGFMAIQAAAQDAVLTWNGHKHNDTVGVDCFEHPIMGDKSGMDVEVTGFKISFSNLDNEYFSYELHGDKLTQEVIDKLNSLKSETTTLYFGNIKGLGSSGLSYFTFHGKVVLKK